MALSRCSDKAPSSVHYYTHLQYIHTILPSSFPIILALYNIFCFQKTCLSVFFGFWPCLESCKSINRSTLPISWNLPEQQLTNSVALWGFLIPVLSKVCAWIMLRKYFRSFSVFLCSLSVSQLSSCLVLCPVFVGGLSLVLQLLPAARGQRSCWPWRSVSLPRQPQTHWRQHRMVHATTFSAACIHPY